jgi:quinol-cytochrome oxidoreductase complex cytochrome b subunit
MSEKDIKGETIPFFPDHIATEAKVTLGVLGVIVIVAIIGMLVPVGLGEPADPLVTPAHTKPEWYFLALYQLLKYMPKTIGALTPVILAGIIMLWPFFDRKPETSKRVQRIRLIVIAIGMLILVVLTIWGEVS